MRFLPEASCWIDVGGIEGHKGVWCLIKWKGVIVRRGSSALFCGKFVSFVIASHVCASSDFAILMWCLEVLMVAMICTISSLSMWLYCENGCLVWLRRRDAPMIGENRQLVTNEPVEFEK